MTLYPLKFEPIYLPKVWGGRSLTALGRSLPGSAAEGIGESWEIADLPGTSTSGAGGGAMRSRVAHGPLAGRSLHDLIQQFGPRLLGSVRPTDDGDFPLLVKYLDARQNLSVQVHPSEAYAACHPEAHLKCEAWYILDAKPGAVIYKGVRDGVSADQFRRAIADGSVEKLLIHVPARIGDCHYLPTGTCHALGAGIVVAEVQTPSDTTFRVYDWGRTGRELHTEPALQCITFGPAHTARFEPDTLIQRGTTTLETLVRCEHFRIEKAHIPARTDHPLVMNHQPAIWMILTGSGRITGASAAAESVPFDRGQTLLLPAEMDHPHVHFTEPTTWLIVTFPEAMSDAIA